MNYYEKQYLEIVIKACQFCIKSSVNEKCWPAVSETISSVLLNCKNKTCFLGIMTQQPDIKMA